jgi:hypothetical protein
MRMRMRMRVLFGVASLAAMVGMLWGTANPARACSVGEDFSAVDASDVIVAGRITAWELVENVRRWDPKTGDEPIDDPNFYGPGPYNPIRLQLDVEHVYKGPRMATVSMVDANSLEIYNGVERWVGSSGACGAFDADPSGQFVILGLNRDHFERYRTGLPLVFFVGPEPAGEHYERATDGLNNAMADDFPWLPAAVAATLGPLAFLAGAAFVWRRGEPHGG